MKDSVKSPEQSAHTLPAAPIRPLAFLLAGAIAVALTGCTGAKVAAAAGPAAVASPEVTVAVVKIGHKDLAQTLTLSSELVPYQEIDVFAKESGYVKTLNVDYGSHVKANDVLATLEIPELQSQLLQDDEAIRNANDQISYAQNQVTRATDEHKVLQLQFDRLSGVAKTKPGLVAQQEVDDAEGKALSSSAQVDAAKSSLQSARSLLAVAQAKKEHDQVLYNYSTIPAPFAGVVTQRYANYGTLMQAGTTSSTQAMPLVRLSEDDKFRLVIPVPESYVRYIHVGDPVGVLIPSLNRTFPGKVARFSVDVAEDTRTMHTEVDVENPQRILMSGMYAEATITLQRATGALAIPLQAVSDSGAESTVDVVNPSGKIDIRQIATGIRTATDAQVTSGLQDGDMVVVGDRSSLKAGEAVHPQLTDLLQYQAQDNQN